MRIHPFKQQALSFVTTNDCTAMCDHCLMCCAPGGKQYLTAKQMINTIKQALELTNLQIVVFTGGEPLLLGGELLETLRFCRAHGVLTRVVTNAYWADTTENANHVLNALCEAGLDELNVSYDDYHADYVPEQNILNAWNASLNKGLVAFVFSCCADDGSRINVPYICKKVGLDLSVFCLREEENTKPFTGVTTVNGTICGISLKRVQATGRAKTDLTDKDWNAYTYAEEDLYRARCTRMLTDPSVGPNNHLHTCCGIQTIDNPLLDVGNLNKETLGDIIKRGSDSVILTAFQELGPYMVLQYLKRKDPDIICREQYHTACEICEDITTDPRAVQILHQNTDELFFLLREIQKMRKHERQET